MKIIGIVEEDFTQYKLPSMFINVPHCTFKCDIECGKQVCQNSELAHAPIIDIDANKLIQRYIENPITKSVVFGGMEPLYKAFPDVLEFIKLFREQCNDPVVIYTGYTEEEVEEQIEQLKQYENIIVKFGRYRYDLPERYDDVLGITLASENQHAVKIS